MWIIINTFAQGLFNNSVFVLNSYCMTHIDMRHKVLEYFIVILEKLYVVQFFCRIIRVIYLMIRRVTTFMASCVNALALLAVEVINEAGVEVDLNAPREALSKSLANDDDDNVGMKPSKGPPSQTNLPKPTASLVSRPSFIEKMSDFDLTESVEPKTSFENLLSHKSFRDWASKS